MRTYPSEAAEFVEACVCASRDCARVHCLRCGSRARLRTSLAGRPCRPLAALPLPAVAASKAGACDFVVSALPALCQLARARGWCTL